MDDSIDFRKLGKSQQSQTGLASCSVDLSEEPRRLQCQSLAGAAHPVVPDVCTAWTLFFMLFSHRPVPAFPPAALMEFAGPYP
jgi:hypothetical protein